MFVGDYKINISGGAEEVELWPMKIATAICFLQDMNDKLKIDPRIKLPNNNIRCIAKKHN